MRAVLLLVFFFVCSVAAYAQERYMHIADISISGNEKTKPQTILREFRYSVGDSIPDGRVDAEITNFSDNLHRLMLFNNIDVSYSQSDSTAIAVNVNVEERWYYWIYPILEIADRNLTSYFHYKDYRKINYGVAFDWLNFRGRNEMLNFKVRLGYKEHYAVSYQKPNIGRNRSSGIWVKTEYFRQKKDIAYIEECKPVYAENENAYIRGMIVAGAGYVFRPGVNYDFSLSLSYQNIVSRDSMLAPEGKLVQNFIVPSFAFDYDNRDSKVCPTSGLHAEIGVNVFSELASSSFGFASLGFEYNCSVFRRRIFYHGALSHRQFFGASENIPMNERIELCRSNLIRGFDYYYILARNFSAIQNTFSIKILDRRDFSLPKWIPTKFRNPYIQIYADLFADLAYCSNFAPSSEVENPLTHKPIYSAGAGLTFETYYDRALKVYVAYNGNFDFFGVFVDYKTPIYKKF
ncbi:MAG: BamA/TamA family outer membrane protein [Bacteroidales bacterium]|nr:BamA/TamA family outer membrane protein [Bacteroidales bacterium]